MLRSWMRVAALLVCWTSVAVSQDGAPLETVERQALAALERGGLDELRAAAGRPAESLSSVERADLARLQARNPELSGLRAGEITDHELKLILITTAVVVVIALLL
jgi:hypothetical protein